ncbi:hypothetical protein NPIL_358441 [Nephila pilipes]|uniref:Uncharacterized protein n=1 Tax=Nephila pilipes TaxID=299642 RepID=A0A8X6TMB4_NEPPI|nr:hypothetical protein NPIL_358441 [Nephila pilipes]
MSHSLSSRKKNTIFKNEGPFRNRSSLSRDKPSVTWKWVEQNAHVPAFPTVRLARPRKTATTSFSPSCVDIRSDGREIFVRCDAIVSLLMPLHLRFNAARSLVDRRAIILSPSHVVGATIGE